MFRFLCTNDTTPLYTFCHGINYPRAHWPSSKAEVCRLISLSMDKWKIKWQLLQSDKSLLLLKQNIGCGNTVKIWMVLKGISHYFVFSIQTLLKSNNVKYV